MMIKRPEIGAAVLAGIAAGVGYLVQQEFDNRLTGKNLDDLLLLGRPFAKDRRRAKALGALIHAGNSAGIGILYAVAANDRLPGPAWARGMLFLTVETCVLYPVMMLDRYHPAVKAGQIDRYWTLPALLQSFPRHLVFGALLGSLYVVLSPAELAEPNG
jgi:hypothetical protein